MSGIIKGLGGWLKNSFIDFPGTVSTVLFFNRCNLKCPYCHNPDLVSGKISKEHLSEEIWHFLKKRKGVINGVVLSGGEPTVFNSIESTVEKIRELGYKIKLDTNGLMPEMILKIKPDYLALDLKTLHFNYADILKANINSIEEKLFKSIEIVKQMKDNAEIRITAAPGIIDEAAINEISEMIKGVNRVYLQKFSNKNKVLNEAFFYDRAYEINQSDLEKYRGVLLNSCTYCEIR